MINKAECVAKLIMLGWYKKAAMVYAHEQSGGNVRFWHNQCVRTMAHKTQVKIKTYEEVIKWAIAL